MLALIALQTLTSPAHAHDDPLQGTPRGFGLGVVLGEPTGISLALRPNVHNYLGGRIPLGFAIHPRDVPLEPFLEVAPGVLVFPETDVIVEGALGLRYYF